MAQPVYLTTMRGLAVSSGAFRAAVSSCFRRQHLSLIDRFMFYVLNGCFDAVYQSMHIATADKKSMHIRDEKRLLLPI